MKKCNLCSRILDNPDDPFSYDCGGDCVWCMIPIEFEVGDYNTVVLLLDNIKESVYSYSYNSKKD